MNAEQVTLHEYIRTQIGRHSQLFGNMKRTPINYLKDDTLFSLVMHENYLKQAEAELCQAQFKLRPAS